MKTETEEMSELARHLSNLSVCPGWTLTTDKKTAKALLMHEFVFCNGDRRNIRSKHLGCGVYKVFTEESR